MKHNFEQDELKSKINIPTTVPEFINERIDDTLRNLGNGKKSRRSVKKTAVIMAASISIISTGTIAAFAQDLPIVKSLVEFVSPSAAKNYEAVKTNISDSSKNTTTGTKKTAVNKAASDQGITLTVNDMAYDGATLIVGFKVSKQGGFSNTEEAVGINLFSRFCSDKSTASPIIVTSRTASSTLTKQSNSDYAGYASFYFGDQDPNIQENFTLTLTADEVGGVNGHWTIDTGLTREDIYTAAQITESNNTHSIENGNVSSVKINRSALGNIISLKGTYKSGSDDMKMAFPGFFILDDKGNCLNYRSLRGVSNGNGAFESDISILKIPDDTKKLTVIPFKRTSSKEKQSSTAITKLPATIQLQDKQILISDIERSTEKLVMHYTISGLTDDRQFTYFEFLDKNGKKIEQIEPVKKIRPLDYETGTGTFEIKTDKAQDIEKVVSYGFEYSLLSNFKFDIELQ